MHTVYLALGSNLGDRHQNIQKAIEYLKDFGLRILKISTIIETDPLDAPPQAPFLNAVLKVETIQSPEDLIVITQAIERKIGRVKKIFHGPRVIDIDILFFDDIKLTTPQLIIPHPRCKERSFVMGPLREVDPELCASLDL